MKKEFEVIQVSKDLSYVIEPDTPPNTSSVNPYKVIATIGQKLDGVPMMVVDEVENIKQMAGGYFPNGSWTHDEYEIGEKMFVKGYKAAQRKGVYSEEDMGKFSEFLFENWINNPNEYFKNKSDKWLIAKWKESIPKQIKSVVLEMELHPVNHASGLEPTGDPIMDVSILQNYKPKLTTHGEIVPVVVRY